MTLAKLDQMVLTVTAETVEIPDCLEMTEKTGYPADNCSYSLQCSGMKFDKVNCNKDLTLHNKVFAYKFVFKCHH